MDTPYTGAAVRARFSYRPPVPGLNTDHYHPDPEPDIFNPIPDTPADASSATIWSLEDPAPHSNYPNLAEQPVKHWWPSIPPAASNTPRARAMQEQQDRMMYNHSQSNYVPDSIRLYQNATEGVTFDSYVGRPSMFAGQDIPAGPLEGLQNGANSYDATNDPGPVPGRGKEDGKMFFPSYSGDDANVARYRLGRATTIFGKYAFWTKQGQDAMLHAYTGLNPALPIEKAQLKNTAPYTPNSQGAGAFWAPAQSNQVPSIFGLPSETAITDASIANGVASGNGFYDDNAGSEFLG